MTAVSYRHLSSTRDAGVERLTLNRPEVRNALNDDVISELADWAARVRDAGDIRVVVIEGAGPAFSAGADVTWMAKTVEYSEAENLRDAAALAHMFSTLDTLPVPVVGRVHGAAIGGGAGLAAVCDVVVAEAQTIFGFSEVRLGIVPAVISPFVLGKIGRSAARELFLTGSRFTADRALAIGLVHRVVPAAALDATVDEYVTAFTSAGPEAIRTAKWLIREVWEGPRSTVTDTTTRAIAERRVSPEGQEGLRAFLEKRAPRWAPRG